jgi:predicted DNA-binding ribbon-helix-helix protein
MKTIEVKNAAGEVIAQAEVEDHVNVARLMARLDKRRGQRSGLAIRLRDHIVTGRSGGNINCKCGEVSPTAAAWAAHVAHILIPAAT